YDPYFLSRDLNATFAAVSREAKERVGHRGRAFCALLAMLDKGESRFDELHRPGS
ncbi:MAG: non-canonical purine NTP pyrophosphatase, partial [Gemmatimonadaceae bacterium]